MISDYQLEMGKDMTCQELCTSEVAPEGVYWARILVSENYRVEWSVNTYGLIKSVIADLMKYNRIVDNLPGSTSLGEGSKMYAPGFRLGEVDSETGVIAILFAQLHSVTDSLPRKYI